MKYTHIYDSSAQYDACIGTDYSEPFLAYVKGEERIEYNRYRNNHIGYVDMGYGVMWASCNIGAESPEQTGNLYMWGDFESLDPNTEEEWYNYVFAESDGEGGYYISKYNGEVDSKREDDNILRSSNDYYYASTLALDDDCVNSYYGGAWTLPTPDDISRLYEIADMSFETVNNIECVKLTSTINGNVLYFPKDINCWTNYCDNSYNALSYGVSNKPRSAETQYEIFGCCSEEKCKLRAARGVIGHYFYPAIIA